jgi:hypothetical protein
MSTGHFLALMPLVKKISATQNSPGWIVVIKVVVFGWVSVQKGIITARHGNLARGFRWLNSDKPSTFAEGVCDAVW